ncbi:ssDNA-binding protein [Burkholderia vietnamiensis]|uniref:ssDNA-binding protein n=1 Tax=Burkholderia vietnamiensis TaxID=60552 RepID=UPI0015932787|nr:ssDNA-binding protein [Burkholderia vietnamiensis]
MKVKLTNVRIAFINNLRTAAEFEAGDGKFRYSATFLVEKGSENDKAIEAAIQAVAAEGWPKKGPAMVESFRTNSNKFCYQNGDLKDFDGFEGHNYIAAHRKRDDGRPLLLDNVADPDTNKPARLVDSNGEWLAGKEGRIYAGCYVNATIDIYAQTKTNPGIRCGLMGVQFHAPGDSFSGASRANEDDFEAAAPADTEDELG